MTEHRSFIENLPKFRGDSQWGDRAIDEILRLRAALERLRKRMAEPQQPIIQWDAGTWIAYIDAALEGRE